MTTVWSTPEGASWLILFAIWLVALVSMLGALFVGEVLGQAPCNPCWASARSCSIGRSFRRPNFDLAGICAARFLVA